MVFQTPAYGILTSSYPWYVETPTHGILLIEQKKTVIDVMLRTEGGKQGWN
jgi:hypothetical protein